MTEVSIHYSCYSVSAQIVLLAEWQGEWGPKGTLLGLQRSTCVLVKRVGEENAAKFEV